MYPAPPSHTTQRGCQRRRAVGACSDTALATRQGIRKRARQAPRLRGLAWERPQMCPFPGQHTTAHETTGTLRVGTRPSDYQDMGGSRPPSSSLPYLYYTDEQVSTLAPLMARSKITRVRQPVAACTLECRAAYAASLIASQKRSSSTQPQPTASPSRKRQKLIISCFWAACTGFLLYRSSILPLDRQRTTKPVRVKGNSDRLSPSKNWLCLL